MTEKRYDIVSEEARCRIKGIECILEMVDEGGKFHDSVLEKMRFDADSEILIVDIGDVWLADADPAGRFRFTFRGFMEVNWNYEAGNSFTFDFKICSAGRGDLLLVSFNSLHLEIICRNIQIEEIPYSEEEAKKFNKH